MLPLTILGCVTVVLMLFVVGYSTLSTPDIPTEDIKTLIGKATADPNEDISNDEAAEDGDFGPVHDLLDLLRRPYEDQEGKESYKRVVPEEMDGPGVSMLSCSS